MHSKARKVVFALAATLALGACEQVSSSAPAPASSAHKHAKTVRVADVQRRDTSRAFALTGVTRAAERAVTAFQVSGTLAERPVELGDSVDRGDVLATLDNPQARPQVAAARAQIEAAIEAVKQAL